MHGITVNFMINLKERVPEGRLLRNERENNDINGFCFLVNNFYVILTREEVVFVKNTKYANKP